jgi:putative exporter of polyketide antibiotics
VPKVPGSGVTLTPLVWLTAIAVARNVAGLLRFRWRDINRT